MERTGTQPQTKAQVELRAQQLALRLDQCYKLSVSIALTILPRLSPSFTILRYTSLFRSKIKRLYIERLPVYSPHMFFFFNDTATTEIYTLSLHDALPI